MIAAYRVGIYRTIAPSTVGKVLHARDNSPESFVRRAASVRLLRIRLHQFAKHTRE